MPPLLRPRGRLCHYCNRRSKSRNEKPRHFQCNNCLAENFLDEHGELVDVPPERNSHSTRRFAIPLPDDCGTQISSASRVFCSTCLKNQHLLTETLANYLPAADDEKYAYYEASYPEFRRNLEERYPPLCSRCEPAARKQLEQARYTAKSDHLRRMMERSRQRVIGYRLGWRSLVVTTGEIFFYMSLFGQLGWHLVHIVQDNRPPQRPIGLPTLSGLLGCLRQASTQYKMESGCTDEFAILAPFAISCGFASSWWNPGWKYRLQGRQGRLKRLTEYYQANIAVLLIRLGFWCWTRNSTTGFATTAGQKAAHTLAMMMMLVFSVHNLTRVKFDTSPLVSWQDTIPSLLSPQQKNSPVTSDVADPSGWQQHRPGKTIAESFPIGALAPQPSRQVWKSPIPNESDVDAMEWEPSYTFQANTISQPSRVIPPAGPSPFHGVLPPKPTNRLLHPQPWRHSTEKKAIGLPPGIFDRRSHLRTTLSPEDVLPMAQPKFFSQEDRDADTGLEDIFNAVFSIGDEPVLASQHTPRNLSQSHVRDTGKMSVSTSNSIKKPWYRSVKLDAVHAAKLFFLASSVIIWYAAKNLQMRMAKVEFFILCLVALVSLGAAFSESRRLTSPWEIRHIIPSGLMIVGSAFLAFRPRQKSDSDIVLHNDQPVLIYLFVCCCWELPRLIATDHAGTSTKGVSIPLLRGGPKQPENEVRSSLQDTQSSGVISRSMQSETLPVARSEQMPAKQQTPTKRAFSSRQPQHNPFSRSRSDSTNSLGSHSSNETSTTASTADWPASSLRGQYSSANAGQSPPTNFRMLALDEGKPTTQRFEHDAFGVRGRRMF